jgi:hypothetical protein
MNAGELLKSVIDRYELSEAVPHEVRIAMEKSRKENLVRILKNDACNIFFISAVTSFFLWIKKFGISLSIAKSAVAVTTTCIIGAGMFTATGIYTAKKVIDYLSAETPKTEKQVEKIQDIKINSVKKPIVPGILYYTVAVSQIEMDEVTNEKLSEYTNNVIKELRNIKGAQSAINLNNLDKNHISDKSLSITIMKLEEFKTTGNKSVYRISAKIVNTNNSQILEYASETADNESGIPDSLRKLAKKVSEKL